MFKKFLSLKSLYFLGLVLLLLFFVSPVDSFFTVAQKVPINEDTQIREGYIISYDEDGYVFSRTPYDGNIAGVINNNAQMYLENDQITGHHSLLKNGAARVLVSNSNGVINKGDFITSSTNPGVGQKATETGVVVGKALEGVPENFEGDFYSVQALVDPKIVDPNNRSIDFSDSSVMGSLFESMIGFFDASKENAQAQPNRGIIYIMAILVTLISILVGFFIFGRIALNGINALGRNPLAKNSIITGIVINSIFAILIISVGIFLAYFIVTL